MSFAHAANEPPISEAERAFVAAFLDELAVVRDLGASLDLVRRKLEERNDRTVNWLFAVQQIDARGRHLAVIRDPTWLDLAERLAASLWIQGLDAGVDAAVLREYAAWLRQGHPAIRDWIDACRRWREDEARCRNADEVLVPMRFERDGRLAGGASGLFSWEDTCAQLDELDQALGRRHRLRFQGPFLRPHVSLWS